MGTLMLFAAGRTLICTYDSGDRRSQTAYQCIEAGDQIPRSRDRPRAQSPRADNHLHALTSIQLSHPCEAASDP